MLDEIEKPFAEIVRLYDDTPSLQDRTCNTGIVGKDLVEQWAAGGHVGRASGRNFDSRRDFPYAPYHDAPSRCRCSPRATSMRASGCASARSSRASFCCRHWLANLPAGPVRVELRSAEFASEGIAMTEAFRGDVLVWVRDRRRPDRALPRARRVVVPVAAAGGRDREQHRRRLPALQQIVQLLVFGARSLMRTLLLKSLFARPVTVPAPQPDAAALPSEDAILAELGKALEVRARRLFGRSITIREVDAGSCNGCELEIHALNNAVYDVERFGIKFAASPRHADVLLVTGPVTHNMRVALERTYAATPDPKWVVAVGDCAAGCGVFAESYATVGAVDKVVPVDLVIKGCPPKPIDLVKGLLALMEQATAKAAP